MTHYEMIQMSKDIQAGIDELQSLDLQYVNRLHNVVTLDQIVMIDEHNAKIEKSSKAIESVP